jgi:branched-subunit amino acid aminotransferase/4-amino-4-deoxychorismate lyase
VSLLAVAVAGRGLVDPAGPVFRADDEALLRGAAAFETLRVYGGAPFLLDRHLARLRHSSAELALPRPAGAEELVATLLDAAPPDHVLRLYRTQHDLVATAASLPAGLEELRARGLALHAVDVGGPTMLEGVKSTSYASAFAARREAEAAGADDALLVAGGVVLDTATANVWWVRGGRLYTPATRPGVLPGVTRSLVLEIEAAEEGAFALDELLAADEAFTTSSIREVMPVASIDARSFRPGPVAARLQAALRLRSVP